jgi:uncharacterized protein
MHDALRGARDADVACDGCTACCTASQFVHVEPDEVDARAHIPSALLFPAPGLPPGHLLMGYDEHGHCPMLVDDRCSVSEHRPRPCRTYDCRVFPATGLVPDGDAKVLIAARAARWRFTYATAADRRRHDALRTAAASLLEEHADVPTTALAVRAVETQR